MTPPVASTSAPANVLIVDDNADDVVLFERALRDQRWRVVAASSGRAALLKTQGERFDAIVLDYNLGDMTGTEVLLKLKEAGVQTPILIQSGFGGEFIVARALALGAEGFVAKSSANYAQEIVVKIQDALQRRRLSGMGLTSGPGRDSLQEIERILDDLMERGRGDFGAVGFASNDGFRVATRFRTVKSLEPETICAMAAIAASSCNFIGQGFDLPGLRLVAAEFEGGRFFCAPVAQFGVLFAALAAGKGTTSPAKDEVEFAARELLALLQAAGRPQEYTR